MPYLEDRYITALRPSDQAREFVDFGSSAWKRKRAPLGLSIEKPKKPKELSAQEKEVIGAEVREATQRLARITTGSRSLDAKQLLFVSEGRQYLRTYGVLPDDPAIMKVLGVYLPGERDFLLAHSVQIRAQMAISLLEQDHFSTIMFNFDGEPSPFAADNYPTVNDPDLYVPYGLTPDAAIISLAKIFYNDVTDGERETISFGPIATDTLGNKQPMTVDDVVRKYNERYSRDGLPAIVVLPGRFSFSADGMFLVCHTADNFVEPYGGNSLTSAIYRLRQEDD